jgi:hypothetical protein
VCTSKLLSPRARVFSANSLQLSRGARTHNGRACLRSYACTTRLYPAPYPAAVEGRTVYNVRSGSHAAGKYTAPALLKCAVFLTTAGSTLGPTSGRSASQRPESTEVVPVLSSKPMNPLRYPVTFGHEPTAIVPALDRGLVSSKWVPADLFQTFAFSDWGGALRAMPNLKALKSGPSFV